MEDFEQPYLLEITSLLEAFNVALSSPDAIASLKLLNMF
jgi:hypothetical protein